MSQFGPAQNAKARAMRAQTSEIEAHRRAITLQESSAVMLDRVQRPGRSRSARQRADRARERLWQARAELEHFGQEV